MHEFIEMMTREEYEVLETKDEVQVIFIKGDTINSEADIFKAFHDQTKAEYMGRNWNSLDEVLRDCDWMKRESIFIIHDGMPNLPQEGKEIYERILRTAKETHEKGPGKEFVLPQRKIDFHVALLEGGSD